MFYLLERYCRRHLLNNLTFQIVWKLLNLQNFEYVDIALNIFSSKQYNTVLMHNCNIHLCHWSFSICSRLQLILMSRLAVNESRDHYKWTTYKEDLAIKKKTLILGYNANSLDNSALLSALTLSLCAVIFHGSFWFEKLFSYKWIWSTF